jgi:hypothetical protein
VIISAHYSDVLCDKLKVMVQSKYWRHSQSAVLCCVVLHCLVLLDSAYPQPASRTNRDSRSCALSFYSIHLTTLTIPHWTTFAWATQKCFKRLLFFLATVIWRRWYEAVNIFLCRHTIISSAGPSVMISRGTMLKNDALLSSVLFCFVNVKDYIADTLWLEIRTWPKIRRIILVKVVCRVMVLYVYYVTLYEYGEVYLECVSFLLFIAYFRQAYLCLNCSRIALSRLPNTWNVITTSKKSRQYQVCSHFLWKELKYPEWPCHVLL